jgi:chromosomal replication initiator protein
MKRKDVLLDGPPSAVLSSSDRPSTTTPTRGTVPALAQGRWRVIALGGPRHDTLWLSERRQRCICRQRDDTRGRPVAHRIGPKGRNRKGEVGRPALGLAGGYKTGKTHLLQAIGHCVGENFPHCSLRYVPSEVLTTDFVGPVRSEYATAFKQSCGACDILLVDDIEPMENDEGLQEEFFAIFYSLCKANKQVVLTSDHNPRFIATLEDRILNHFECGLITTVAPPDFETRLAILRNRASREHTCIPSEVLELIASQVTDDIRSLEGALVRVAAFARLTGQDLSAQLAEMLLSDILAPRKPALISPKEILEATAAEFSFSVEQLRSRSRQRELVTARQIGMYLFRQLTDFSYAAIADEFGGRDHTTVIHAFKGVSALIKESRQANDQVTKLLRRTTRRSE